MAADLAFWRMLLLEAALVYLSPVGGLFSPLRDEIERRRLAWLTEPGLWALFVVDSLIVAWLFKRWAGMPLVSSAAATETFVTAVLGLLLVGVVGGGEFVRGVLNTASRRFTAEASGSYQGINNGQIIGYLERLLLIPAVALGGLQAVGFLIGAKGLARFNELRGDDAADRAEYFLIGTLTSVLVGGAVGLLLPLLYVRYLVR